MVFRVAGGVAGGGTFVSGGYGAFVSTANQSNPVANAANALLLDTQIDGSSGVTNTNGLLTFTTAGSWQIMFELAFTSTVGANPVISQWIVKNGSNLANTAQDFQLLGGANTVQMSTCVFLVNALVNDTVQIYWSTSDTRVSLSYQGTLTTPTRPASPSAIVFVNRVG